VALGAFAATIVAANNAMAAVESVKQILALTKFAIEIANTAASCATVAAAEAKEAALFPVKCAGASFFLLQWGARVLTTPSLPIALTTATGKLCEEAGGSECHGRSQKRGKGSGCSAGSSAAGACKTSGEESSSGSEGGNGRSGAFGEACE
jgi:hypothetical protein